MKVVLKNTGNNMVNLPTEVWQEVEWKMNDIVELSVEKGCRLGTCSCSGGRVIIKNVTSEELKRIESEKLDSA